MNAVPLCNRIRIAKILILLSTLICTKAMCGPTGDPFFRVEHRG